MILASRYKEDERTVFRHAAAEISTDLSLIVQAYREGKLSAEAFLTRLATYTTEQFDSVRFLEENR